MYISYGLCWCRSAESSTPLPWNKWSRRNTACRTRLLRLLAVQTHSWDQLQNSLWNKTWNTSGSWYLYTGCKSRECWTEPGPWHCSTCTLQGLIRPLPPPHEGTISTLCTELLLTWTGLQGFLLAAPSINNNGFSSSSQMSKNWSCLLNYFFPDHSYFTHSFIPFPDLQTQLTMPVPPTLQMSRVARDWHQFWNHRSISLLKTPKTLESSC